MQTKLIRERITLIKTHLAGATSSGALEAYDAGANMPLVDLIVFSYAFEDCVTGH
jgi:hypothetical protein